MIVFPMAGLSRRFQLAGYAAPKFMLPLQGRPLFDHCIGGFSALFGLEPFLFIHRDEAELGPFIAARCRALGLSDGDYVTVALEAPTQGQAETVAVGLDHAAADDTAPLTIFNIDTIRPGFRYPTRFAVTKVDGYLEVFRGSGDNWSFVRGSAEGDQRALEVTEKRPISDLCSTGLYHFGRAAHFLDAYAQVAGRDPRTLEGGERYVAPLYNRLIERGLDIRYEVIDRNEVIFCGTPEEYHGLLASAEAERPGGV